MKKIASLLLLAMVLFTACEGDQGPPGLDGELAAVYEPPAFNFNSNNNYVFRYDFPIAIFDADNVLVYRLEDFDNGDDVWEPLPTSTIYFDNGGFLQYRFNFTKFNVDILIESDNFEALGSDFTNNQIFRIVVIPSAFRIVSSDRLLNMDELFAKYSIDPENIIEVSP